MTDAAQEARREDGRRRRRDRNRDAVVEALLSLFRAGNVQPSAAEIAERAGLSQRSLFRYFEDLDALARLAISSALQDLAPLIPVGASSDEPLDVRIRSLATQRVRLFDEAAPIGIVSRLRAPFQGVVREQIDRTRRYLRRQVADLFAVEVAGMEPADATRAIAVIDVLTSFESHQLFRLDQGLTSEATVELLVAAISAQLGVVV